LHRASTGLKHFFINPTDAHNYKIAEMLKQLKFPQLLQHVSVQSGTITLAHRLICRHDIDH
jgi:hypothetical protein